MGAGVDPLVQDIGLCLLGAGALGVVFARAHLPQVGAFLATGVLLGPVGLGWVADDARINTISGLGLAFLLFLIGLEVDPRGLLASGRSLLLTGLLQVPLTVLVGFGLFTITGIVGAFGGAGPYDGLYLALIAAFSSTLLVVPLLQRRIRLDTQAGRFAVGLLVFQDVWAIVFLAVQPDLEKPEIGPIVTNLVAIAFVALVAGLVARFVLPRAFGMIARQPELVVTAALGWCFGVGLFGSHLGEILELFGIHLHVSVSVEMGALIAGATLATLPYAVDVVGKVTNLRDFFVTLFFVGLGLNIPVPEGTRVVLLALGIAGISLLLRGVVFAPLMVVTGFGRRHAVEASGYLAQISEFSLVIAFLGKKYGHVSADLVAVLILAFVVTTMATPFLFQGGEKFGTYLVRRLSSDKAAAEAGSAGGGHGDAPRVAILGYHRVGMSLLATLAERSPALVPEVAVVDFNAAVHAEIRGYGARVVYGDLSNQELLRHAGIGQARVLVLTLAEDLLKSVSPEVLVRQLRALAPDAWLIASAITKGEADKLRAAGADDVLWIPQEAAENLAPRLLDVLNGTPHEEHHA